MAQQQPPPPPPGEPSPLLFFETVNAYQRSAALKGAIDLDLFTAVAEGNASAAALASRVGADERGVRILADYLVILGFLTKADGRYALTRDTGIFLDKRSPAYVGGAVDFLLSPGLTDAFKDMAAVARKGGTTQPEGGTTAPEHAVWVRFARAMGPMMAKAAEGLAELADPKADRPVKVLDISASHGTFGIALARRNKAARIVGLDWPNVLEVAKENAEAAGVGDRYDTIGGSAFEADFGRDYDVVLLPNFLHHFDAATCAALMRKVHASLKPGGRAATLEFIPEPDRVTPPPAGAFALTMLATTPAGDAYTFAEYEQMFRKAGFNRNELHVVPGAVQRAVVSFK
jgi:ubiquinone/menaquinone biosynthesis C-methylase UbiE